MLFFTPLRIIFNISNITKLKLTNGQYISFSVSDAQGLGLNQGLPGVSAN